MKNLIKFLVASSLVLGFTAFANGGTAFGGRDGVKADSGSVIMANGGTAFGGRG